jgi:hypothetical protein
MCQRAPPIHLGLPYSCSKCSLGGRLPHKTRLCLLIRPEMWNFASSFKRIRLSKSPCSKIYAHICAADCYQSCLSYSTSFWAICILCSFRRRLFRRTLCTFVCDMCNSALSREIDFLRLRTKAYLARAKLASDLLRRLVECRFPALPVSLNCSYYLLMLLSSSGLTQHSRLKSHWTEIMDSSFAYHKTVCAFCCTVDIILCRTKHVIKAAVR